MYFFTESCQQNMNAVAACENGYCRGTYFDYTCECKKPAFMQNPINPRECIDGKYNLIRREEIMNDKVNSFYWSSNF